MKFKGYKTQAYSLWPDERWQKGIFSILIIISSTLLFSCEEFTTWDLDLDAEKQLVVEALLTDENTKQEIRLSQSFNELNGEALPVEDAIVYVEANGVIYPFSPMASDPGLYLSENPFAVRRNLTYSLNINWQGKLYDASSKLSSVGPIPTISFFEDSNTDSLQLAEIGGLFNLNEQSMYEVNISWDHLTNIAPTEARLFFYSFNSLHISEFIRPEKAKVVFPKGSIVEVRKFGLNDDFAVYLRALAIETEWNGSVFYGQSDNLPTNISNEGIGFFSTCAVVVDTVVAE